MGEAEQRGDLRELRAYDTRRSQGVARIAAGSGASPNEEECMSGSAAAVRTVFVVTPIGTPLAELFAQRSDARLALTFARAGAPAEITAQPNAARMGAGEFALLVRGDAVLDERIARALLTSGELALVGEGARPVAAVVAAERVPAAAAWLGGDAPLAGLALRCAGELVPAYTSELRKLAPPFLRIASPDNSAAIERALFDASYKGVTDFVTKYAWPPLAFRVVKACARLGITPNGVTLLSWLLVGLATLEFARGAFGAGLAAAWLMTFLDTVDGKLARVTQNSSPIGHWLDHGLDLAHPPIWWGAWALGIGASLTSPAALVVVCGYVVGRLVEGIFMLACGFETHSWRPLDSFFRLITARRNPNLALLSGCVLAGAPALGYELVAWWTGLSIAFHVGRLFQALALRASGRAVRPWEEEVALEHAGSSH